MGRLLDADEEAAVRQFLGSFKEDPAYDPAAEAQAAADAGAPIIPPMDPPKKGRKKKGPSEPILIQTTSNDPLDLAPTPTLTGSLAPEAVAQKPMVTTKVTKASQIRQMWATGMTRGAIAKALGISFQQVYGVTKGLTQEAATAPPGNCTRCGKELTDPRTNDGMGPICAQKAKADDEED